MEKIIDSIVYGDDMADIIELKNGYEAKSRLPAKLTWGKRPFSERRNANTLFKVAPHLYLLARFVYKKISDHYLIIEESGSGARIYSEPIKILEPDLPKKKVKEICLELLIKEAKKQ